MSRSLRPWTPPDSLATAKAASSPVFMPRPSSLMAPEKGEAMPKTTSVSETPATRPEDGATGGACSASGAACSDLG
jgi:hypothetical protein